VNVSDHRLRFLNLIERQESKLLSWGLVDGSFSSDEMDKLCADYLEENGLWGSYDDEEEFQEDLENAGLLFKFQDGMRRRYRTRMGETLRLLARLRQLFPKHLEGENRRWQIAKPLVGDYRFMLRPRTVPQRSLTADEVQQRIEKSQKLKPLQKEVLREILSLPNDGTMKLSHFQARATENILSKTKSNRSSGTIVCAGTGSGKTLSFYLPAFMSVAETIDASNWTRCLAIYPRNELLKDQLSEAYRQARKLDAILSSKGKRKLSIATLFGPTPNHESAFGFPDPPRYWIRTHNGDICPFLNCPNEDCHGQMVWKTEDRKNCNHRLCCSRCPTTTEDDELILTRQRLQSKPADILFTTTEMLNQRLGDSDMSKVFGVGVPRGKRPTMVLLDEVHTYAGISGAQTAMLLRRWKHAADVKPHFVGLSATLADARNFFATLIGESSSRVEEVSPHSKELDRVGMEYLVALRGDPASQSSLLSTSIQTAMLMRRTLDAPNNNTSPRSHVYGSKEFVFTDDLDVTNRMFYNLLDAEGQNSWGQADASRHPNGSLANLRNPQLEGRDLRYLFGQSWDLCEELGHSLRDGDSPLRIDRVSSQDAGVASTADIIVATASLEVGFNDPEVNVVLQHKAPRDPAQFLQRKGRAGRRIEMRPWTIVTLSDYGRDRLTWESFDLLFDPELPPRELPVRNHYVLRMQVVFAFLDWIATRLRSQTTLPKGSVYRDCSGPAKEIFKNPQRILNVEKRQQVIAGIVEGLLLRDEGYHELVDYLTKALQQPEETIEALLWAPPRALMNAVVPTLLRRLRENWGISGQKNAYDNFVDNSPLPEFVPSTLFSDLNLPEVTLQSPPQRQGEDERVDVLPVLQSMREFAPGRVSRRFAVRNSHARHWIEPGDLNRAGEQTLELHDIVSRHDELGQFERFDDQGKAESIRCIRPREMRLVVPETQVRDSSNSTLKWCTQVSPLITGTPAELPEPFQWSACIQGMTFFTHNLNNPLEMRRFATGAHATLKLGNRDIDKQIHFVSDRTENGDGSDTFPVGIGFAIDVDGLLVQFLIPKNMPQRLEENPAMLRCLRLSRFRDLLVEDGSLEGVANVFQIGWLSQVFLSALTNAAINEDKKLGDVFEESRAELSALNFAEVLGVIFQSITISSQDDENESDGMLEDVQQQLQTDLEHLLDAPIVIGALQRHASVLWESPNDGWNSWLTRKYKSTLGAAILDAVQQVCSDLDSGDLILDIDSGPRPPHANVCMGAAEEIWITEKTIGGGGIIESFLARYGEDPRRFFELVKHALRPSDYEVVDEQLTVLLNWMNSSNETEIQDHITNYRDAATRTHDEHAQAFGSLQKLLTQRGLHMCHGVVSAIANRILRPGSNRDMDNLLHDMITRWRTLEETLGVEIDPRVLAYVVSADESIDSIIGAPGENAIDLNPRQRRFNQLFSLLWPRGGVSRSARLTAYNPFSRLPETEHDLVLLALDNDATRVSVDNESWLEQSHEVLVRDNKVVLFTKSEELPRLRKALMTVMTTPVENGFLFSYPKITRVDRRSDVVEIELLNDEGLQ
jgi:hypothetical protein